MDDMMLVFRQTYLEESFEGLSAMESQLLELPVGTPDSDTINIIFRAAHSMKGGAGTFGFKELIHLTHTLETLLDEMRSGKREVTIAARDALLESVDVLRNILEAYQSESTPDVVAIKAMDDKLNGILGAQLKCNQGDDATQGCDALVNMVIKIEPEVTILHSGNYPTKFIEEIKLAAKVDEANFTCENIEKPSESLKDVEMAYGYDHVITIKGTTFNEADVREILEWIDGTYAKVEIDVELIKDDKPSSSETISQPIEKVESKSASAPAEQTIRVAIPKIDQLVNLVGEMVIAQSMIGQYGDMADQADMPWADKLKEGLASLERYTRELQENVMSIRMLPISFAFNRMPRIVHDVSSKLGKNIELVMVGQDTEVDKTVLEKLTDPLVHIVRNSIDHGIELPQARLDKGKPEKGTVTLAAFHQGGNIVIQIKDDGAGINLAKVKQKAIESGVISENQAITDKEIVDLIFHAGFSTAEQVTDISGRGVGMDVVRRNIKELGGSVDVETTPGSGSVFTIRLPLTLAILDGQLAKVGNQVFVFPLASIVESIQPESSKIKSVSGKHLYQLREDYLPILRLHEAFGVSGAQTDLTKALLVIVEFANERFGILVDSLEGQQQVVIKSLEQNYHKVSGVSGATILGDGRVALILELSELKSILV